jgi:glycosyltransferase involved in cell wall biosynthesis
MKILSVIDSLAHGGAETVLVDLVLGLREHEHRVVHCSAVNAIAPHEEFLSVFGRAGVVASDVHWQAFSRESGRAEILAGFDPDVVLFHWWGRDPWKRWVGSRRHLPLSRRPYFVLVLHHAGIAVPRGYDRYVLVAGSQRDQVGGVPPDRVHLIPNGVDLRRFPPRSARRHRGSEMVVGRLSSLREGKIPADWIDAVASYGVRGARFVIAGDGPLRVALERRTAELGHEDRVSFTGYVPRGEAAEVLGGFDVLCYTTANEVVECHPLALLEALAAGVPIVAEARGGVPEIVAHGVNGLLATSRDDVGAHLRRLRCDEGLRDRLTRGARATASRFALDRQIAAYRALLRLIEAERAGYDPRAWRW